jgi:hypothetical protein
MFERGIDDTRAFSSFYQKGFFVSCCLTSIKPGILLIWALVFGMPVAAFIAPFMFNSARFGNRNKFMQLLLSPCWLLMHIISKYIFRNKEWISKANKLGADIQNAKDRWTNIGHMFTAFFWGMGPRVTAFWG